MVPGVNSFADMLARATQVGTETLIDFGGGNRLALRNTVRSSLSADDFGFFANSEERFRRRRQGGHSLAERRRHARDLADERHQRRLDGAALTNPGPAWHVMDAGDFDGDGKADICGRTQTARLRSG